MAENNVQNTVLQVDTGNAIKSVKEYKAYLEELKVILLGLEKGSEEYNAVLKLLHQEQDKLNEVVADSKRGADAAEGSYKQLSQTMSDLKKEWKATGDEARRAELGTQIKEINDQLKDMDASVGDFHRNVGNYAESFEEAFKSVLGGLGQVDGAVGDIAKTTNGMIPLIKKTTQIATAGLTGIKKAIAATGIGALIIAIGVLISNFDALRKTVGITDEKFAELKGKVLNVFENIAAGVFGVGNALIQMLLMPIKNIIDAFATLGNVMGKVFQGQFRQAVVAAKNGIKDISNNITQGLNFKANFEAGRDFGRRLIQNIKEGAEEEEDSGGGASEVVEKDIEKIEALLERLRNYNRTDEELIRNHYAERRRILQAAYEEELALLEGNEEAQLKLRREFISNLQDINREEESELARHNQAKFGLANGPGISTTGDPIQSAAWARVNAQIEANRKEYEAQQQSLENLQKYVDNYQLISSSIGALIGSTADAWEASVQAQIDSGEISEEEGKKQFERIKRLQIAEATINTISGIVAALTAPVLQGAGPFGWAAAAAQAAALTVAGVAQIKKIQSTNIGSSGSLSSSIPGVNKAASETAPNYVQVATSASDIDTLRNAFAETPIYVKVSDIDSAQQGNQVRVVETSF